MNIPGDEHAKALQEVAKLGQKVVDSGKKLFDGVLEELGEWGGSYFRTKRQVWEYKNWLATFDKVDAINRERLGQGKPVPISARQSVPLLEAIAVEDEPSLQELWAKLIANATNPGGPREVKRAFVDVLRSIDPSEAIILERLRPMLAKADPTTQGETVSLTEFAASIGAPEKEVLVGLYHLAGLGCIRISGAKTFIVIGGPPVDPWPSISADEATFSVTPLTVALLEACAA